jgi:gas vesicle protein
MSFGKFLAGLLGGTALGVFFARDQGKNLRKKLQGKNPQEMAKVLTKEFVDVGQDIKNSVQEFMESKEVKKVIKKGKKTAVRAKNTAKKAIQKKVSQVSKDLSSKK